MAEGVVAAMDFLGIESHDEKEVELMKYGSNSKRIQANTNVVVNASVAKENYNNNTGSKTDAINSKNDASNSFCEKGKFFSAELKLGLGIEEQSNEKSFRSSIQSVGGAKRAASEFIPRLDLSAVGNSTNSIDLFPNQSGFGSPIEVTGGFNYRTSSYQDGCRGLGTSFRPVASKMPGKQSAAQLTIFYGGTVNVYDNIPADKGQAIMLMASSGNYSSYSHNKVQNGCGSHRPELKTALPFMKLLEGSGIHHQVASCKVHTDLPITRKHSLQRFLERRKDRLNGNAKTPYTVAEADNTKPQQYPSSLCPISQQ